MAEVGFSFGSNIGDKAAHVAAAVRALDDTTGVSIETVSSLFRTAPWGLTEQDWFLNACAVGTCDLAPEALLALCKDIEDRLGRTTTVRWGPRVIDIDILFFDDEHMDSERLTLPHRELFRRTFVLVPLAEIAPDREIAGMTVSAALALLPREPGDVELYAPET